MKIAAGFGFERRLWKSGVNAVAGIDEVGRGSWAGPVVAAAVVFPKNVNLDFEVFDSKLLLPSRRETISSKVYSIAKVGIGVVKVPTINKIGIGRASQKAFKEAVRALPLDPEYFLIDAFYIQSWARENQMPIKKGDRVCASIAAASVVAKVYRDSLMRQLDKKHPGYGLAIHKGYGTKMHQKALSNLSLSSIHRKSFNLKPFLSAG